MANDKSGSNLTVMKASDLFPPNFWRLNVEPDTARIVANTNKYPYKLQIWVYACIHVIAENLSSLTKVIRDTRIDGTISDHPILDLLSRPNPNTYGNRIFEQIAINLLLDGQVFVVGGNHENLKGGQLPAELFLIKDQYMKALRDPKGIITGWVYEPRQETRIKYPSEEVIRINLYNPYEDDRGASPYDPIKNIVMMDANAVSFNVNFFKNNAMLGGTLETENKLNESQAKEIADQFREAFSGADKAGKIALLHSGLTYNTTSASHKDMQFEKQMQFIKERILAAYRVPKNLISDYEDQNYSNSIAALKSFWTETVLPLDKAINEAFTYQWLTGANPYFELCSDTSKVKALQTIGQDTINAFKTLVDSGIPKEEAARLLDIPVDWDYVEELEEEEEQPQLPTPEEEPMEEPEEEELSLDLQPYIKNLKATLNKYYTGLRNRCLDKHDAGKPIDYDINETYKDLAEALKETYLGTVKDFIAATKANGDEALSTPKIINLLNSASESFKQNHEDILNSVKEMDDKRTIHAAFQEQYSLNKNAAEETIKHIAKEFELC